MTLIEDLCASMERFADYLDDNADKIPEDQHLPQARWERGFWMRFCPDGMAPNDWLCLGEREYSVPA